MIEKANLEQIRQQNRGVILQSLRQHSSIARVDLGRKTKLSPATVTSITSELIGEGLILEHYQTNTEKGGNRGRPKVFLTLNGEAAYVVGIVISLNSVQMHLTDYKGKKLDNRLFEIQTEDSTESQFMNQLLDKLKEFCLANKVIPEQLTEIGVSAQGVVNSNLGTISWSPAFSERNINIKSPVENAFGVHCRVSNDANMITQALYWKDPNHYHGSFAVLFTDYGVGGGLLMNNRLFTGITGAAAEFGHVNHIPNGNLCRCGKKGCLEAYLSDYAIFRTAEQLPADYDPRKIKVSRKEFTEIVNRAHSGEKWASTAFQEAGSALGYGIARLIATLGIGTIVITGAVSEVYSLLKTSMNESLDEALVKDLYENVKIVVYPWQDEVILTGIIASALHRLDTSVFATSRNTGNMRRSYPSSGQKASESQAKL